MKSCDLLIIGGGVAGCRAAALASNAGLKTILLERKELGGVCVNEGCIPFKSFIELSKQIYKIRNNFIPGLDSSIPFMLDYSALVKEVICRVQAVQKGIWISLKKTEVIFGEMVWKNNKTVIVNGEEIIFSKIILATGIGNAMGESPARLLFQQKELPKETVVIGANYTGVEVAAILAWLGSKVTLLEKEEKICPEMPFFLRREIESCFQRLNVTIKTSCTVTEVTKKGEKYHIRYIDDDRNTNYSLVDLVLPCNGRIPQLPKETTYLLGIHLDNRRFIVVDQNMQTNNPSVYAIGDVTAGYDKTAYVGMKQAEIAVKSILGEKKSFCLNDYFVPHCLFAPVETSWFGDFSDLSQICKKKHYKSCGRALSKGEIRGYVQIALDETGIPKGAAIIGEQASELIQPLLFLAQSHRKLEEWQQQLFLHPTFSELLME